MRDRDGDAALRRPVQLRQRDPGHADGVAEEPGLLQPVLAGGRVDDEQGLVRRARQALLDHAADLGELLHQVGLRVQASRGVDDDDVAPAGARRLDRVVGDRGGVAAARRADEVGAGPLGPDLQLLLGRGAKRVGRGQDDAVPVLAQHRGELSDRRRLARAVHADDEHDARPLLHGERARVAEQALELLRQRRAKVAVGAARLQPLHELGRGGHADVGHDQRLLEPLPGRLVGGVEGGERDLGRQRLAALRERVAQPGEEARALLLGLGGAVRLAEQVCPRPRHRAEGSYATARVGACGVRRETTCDTPSGPIVTP